MQCNKIKRIGFLVDHLGPSQLAYQLIFSANKLLAQSDKVDVCLFFRNFQPPVITPIFGTFTAYEGLNYNGIMVATDLQSASYITKWAGPNRSKMYFYLNELEWLRFRDSFSYESLAMIYNHPKLNLICRSQEHANLVEICWKTPFGVVPNGDVKRFAEILEQ